MDHSIRVQIGLAAAAALLAAAPVRAAEPAAQGKTVTEQVLDILREQGTLDETRYQALKLQAEQERRALEEHAREQAEKAEKLPAVAAAGETAQPAEPAKPDPEGWRIYFKDYLRIERNDGQYKLHVGGMTQWDIAGIDTDQDLKDAGFNNQGNGEEFRRARLSIDGELGENAIFKAEYDFAGGDANFADVWMGLQRIPYVGRLQAGHFKEPYSLEEQTSDRFITFMERALPVLAFSPARNAGVALSSTAFQQRLTWGVGAFRDANNFGNSFSNQELYNVTARVTGLPVYQEDGGTLVHVGYNYSHRFRDDDNVSFAPDPEVHLSDPIVDTGNIPANGVDVFGAELATVIGPVSLQGEFMDALVDQASGSNANLWGGYAYASWFVTGEHRAYDLRTGAFARTSPKESFSFSKGQWGALELGARYSYVDLNNGDVRGGIESDVTAAVNWYLYSNLRLMLNYVWAHRNNIGDQNTVMTRFSLDF